MANSYKTQLIVIFGVLMEVSMGFYLKTVAQNGRCNIKLINYAKN